MKSVSKKKNIVVLHGWNSKIKRWKKFQRQLEKNGFQVLLPQLPGFGRTKILKPWNLDDYVDWLRKFINQKKLKDYVLLGHSFGGRMAIKFASRKPKQLRKLILVASAGLHRRFDFKKLVFLIFAKTGKAFFLFPPFCCLKKPARWLLYTLAGEKDYYRADKVMKRTMKKIIKEDLKPILNKIKTSTLIVWGEKDKVAPLKNAYLMKETIANSQLVIYDDGGHDLPFKKTKKLVQEVTDFCSPAE